jgi:hypothetical protein
VIAAVLAVAVVVGVAGYSPAERKAFEEAVSWAHLGAELNPRLFGGPESLETASPKQADFQEVHPLLYRP